MDETGRLIYDSDRAGPFFSWFRFGVIASILTFFWVTNPANHECRVTRLLHRCLGRDPANNSNSNKASSSYFYNTYYSPKIMTAGGGSITNFGLFSVKASTIRVSVQMAGSTWDCRYDDPDIGIPLCFNILRRHLTHQKPLWWSADDPVWMVHRGVLWCLAATALASLCCRPSRRPWRLRRSMSKVPLLDSLLSMLGCSNDDNTFEYVAYSWLQMQLFVYPALEAMYQTIQHQSQNSSFAVFDTADRNFYFSCAALLGMAVLTNEASRAWSGQFLLRMDAVTAVAMGYYAHHLTSLLTVYDNVLTLTLPWNTNGNSNKFTFQIDWQTATWTLLVSLVFRRSLATALFWSLAHCAGQSLSEYQFNHTIYVVSARAVVHWVESSMQSMERGLRTLLGGVPHV